MLCKTRSEIRKFQSPISLIINSNQGSAKPQDTDFSSSVKQDRQYNTRHISGKLAFRSRYVSKWVTFCYLCNHSPLRDRTYESWPPGKTEHFADSVWIISQTCTWAQMFIWSSSCDHKEAYQCSQTVFRIFLAQHTWKTKWDSPPGSWQLLGQ